jgi:hypothetical protein
VPVCLEKHALLAEYNAYTQEYAAATREMVGNRTTKAFDDLTAIAEKARLRCEAARQMFNKHRDEYRC